MSMDAGGARGQLEPGGGGGQGALVGWMDVGWWARWTRFTLQLFCPGEICMTGFRRFSAAFSFIFTPTYVDV